jgi:putative sigma-54 modulation protein
MNIMITGRSIKVTEGIKKKIEKMLTKHKKLLESVNKVEVELKRILLRDGVNDTLQVEITITMPKAMVRVEENGRDFYAIIDKIDPVLRRRLIRYNDSMKKWEGKESWKMAEMEKFNKELEEIKEDTYAGEQDNAMPLITRYKQFSQNSPIHPAEAIERMALIGHEAFLFKNIETNKYAMVYKRNDGTYGLVEPKE